MRVTAFALGLALSCAPALAETADFLGNWLTRDGNGIGRVVIAPAEGDRATIRVFGPCGMAACDWGTRPARLYADRPGGTVARSIAVEFDDASGHRRVTFHLAVNHALRYDLESDPVGGRIGFATSGTLTFAGDWQDAPRIAEAAPPVATVPGAAPAPPIAAPPPAPSSSGWFGDNGFIGVGARRPPGYVAAAGEDCTPFDPGQTHAAPVDGAWRLGDFSHRLINFGPRREAAQRALAVINYFHFDEECFVTRAAPVMLYWKRSGLVPKDGMPGADCDAIDPAAVKAERRGEAWKVVSGGIALLDFGDDAKAADSAASVIHTYKLNRLCRVAGGEGLFQYWLAQ